MEFEKRNHFFKIRNDNRIDNKKINKYNIKKEKNIYSILKYKQTINLSRKIIKEINGKNIVFNSGTPSIIEYKDNNYLINIRWINYYKFKKNYKIF